MSDVDVLQGSLAGRYAIEEAIGRGGMATVYRARDLKHGRLVAVKVLRADLGEAIGPERFLREIEIAARLTHPNILPLYDSGDAGGRLYYVMPFIEGESLRGLLARVRLMDTDGAVALVRRVADALDYAHARGIVHRDIKPENILLPGGQPVVADFGIAKAVSGASAAGGLTRTGIALGTPGYMSPEQAAGVLELNATTDVYSLGVVTYEMLVGGLPRAWVTPEYLGAGRFVDAAPDHRALLDRLPPGMERALVRALALRPEERFGSPGEFAGALERPETLARPARVVTALPPLAGATDQRAASVGPPYTGRAALGPAAEPHSFLGASTTLLAERVVEGEVPPEAFDALVEEARAAFHVMGYAAQTERSLLWTGRRPRKPFNPTDLKDILESGFGGDAPDAVVRVGCRAGQTRIRVEFRLGEIAGGIFGGVMGGMGGGGLAVTLAVGIAVLALPVPALVGGSLAFVGGSWGLSRAIYRAVARAKQAAVDRLADGLVERCEEAIS